MNKLDVIGIKFNSKELDLFLTGNGFDTSEPINKEEIPNGVRYSQELEPLKTVTVKGKINLRNTKQN